MTFLVAHAPDGLLALGGVAGTSHRFLFKIGGRNTTTVTKIGSGSEKERIRVLEHFVLILMRMVCARGRNFTGSNRRLRRC